jgi:hypothetical protein
MRLQELAPSFVFGRNQMIEKIASRWAGCVSSSPKQKKQRICSEFLELLKTRRITVGWRKTTEPPGVEVWVYYGDGNFGGPGANPLGAILGVGFAKFQGKHAV